MVTEKAAVFIVGFRSLRYGRQPKRSCIFVQLFPEMRRILDGLRMGLRKVIGRPQNRFDVPDMIAVVKTIFHEAPVKLTDDILHHRQR